MTGAIFSEGASRRRPCLCATNTRSRAMPFRKPSGEGTPVPVPLSDGVKNMAVIEADPSFRGNGRVGVPASLEHFRLYSAH